MRYLNDAVDETGQVRNSGYANLDDDDELNEVELAEYDRGTFEDEEEFDEGNGEF